MAFALFSVVDFGWISTPLAVFSHVFRPQDEKITKAIERKIRFFIVNGFKGFIVKVTI